MLRITFLGTGTYIPQFERNPTSIAIEISPHNQGNDLLLFNCGEGAQKEIMKNKIGLGSISSIFLTNPKKDNILGLPGLLQTWTFDDREQPLNLYCPVGTAKYVIRCKNLIGHQPSYDVRIHEVSEGDSIDREGYSVDVFETGYSETGIGFSLEEDQRKGKFDRKKADELGVPKNKFSKLHNREAIKLENGKKIEPEEVVGPPRQGRKVVYTGDTRPDKKTIKFSKNASVLIQNGTFNPSIEKESNNINYSTAREAADIAREANVDKLILTHINSVYIDPESLREIAKEIFEDTWIAHDGMKVEVEYPEKDNETKILDTP